MSIRINCNNWNAVPDESVETASIASSNYRLSKRNGTENEMGMEPDHFQVQLSYLVTTVMRMWF
jgi:hypothetical protein